jgi:hypothetical protein
MAEDIYNLSVHQRPAVDVYNESSLPKMFLEGLMKIPPNQLTPVQQQSIGITTNAAEPSIWQTGNYLQ